MLSIEQLQYLGLEAAHRAFALEDRVRQLAEDRDRAAGHTEKLTRALEEAQALIERLRKGNGPAAESSDHAPQPPLPTAPARAQEPDDDGVASALDAMARTRFEVDGFDRITGVPRARADQGMVDYA